MDCDEFPGGYQHLSIKQFAVARECKLAIATQDKDFQRIRNLVDVRLL